jgi:biofilm protein TabA
MALIGTCSDIAAVLAHDSRFSQAFAYALRCLSPGSPEAHRLKALPLSTVEKVWLPDGSLAMEQAYATKARGDCFFESHRMHIDVQCMIEGEEWIDLIPIHELAVTQPYREDKDLIKYADSASGSRLRLRPGLVAVFFPEDGHMPGQSVGDAATPVRKTVVKVPVG